MTTPLFLLRCVQLGISIADLDLLTIGLVNDMILLMFSRIRLVRLSRREKYIATEYERFLRPQNATPLSAVWSKAILLPTM